MNTLLLVLARVVQLLLVPVVGMGAAGATEYALLRAEGARTDRPNYRLERILVVVALIRALTGVGEGMLGVAWAPPVLLLVVAIVGGKGVHGEPPSVSSGGRSGRQQR